MKKKLKLCWVVQNPGKIYTSIDDVLTKSIKTNLIFRKTAKNKLNPLKSNYTFLELYNIPLFSKRRSEFILKDLSKHLKKENPDVVMAILFYRPSTWQAYYYCKKNKLPFIFQPELKQFSKNIFRRTKEKISLFLSNPIIKKSKLILPWTEQGVEFWKKQYPKYENKIKLIPPGVNLEIFHKTKVKRYDKKLKLLMVGRYLRYKRHIDLIKALKILKDKKIDFTLTLQSRNDEKNKLIKEINDSIKKYDLSSNINFIKSVPYTRMNEVYSKHDILILPSFNEAIGTVVPEAMACGVPCVVSDTCGAKTYVEDKKNGAIFETYNYKDLAKKIIYVKDNKEIFGNRAEKHIKNKYDIEIISKKLEKLLEGAVKD